MKGNQSQRIKQQRGGTLFIILLVILIPVAIAGGFYFYKNFFSSALAPETKVCTQEAKQCSDGGYVGRTGPNCEFSPCPNLIATSTSQ